MWRTKRLVLIAALSLAVGVLAVGCGDDAVQPPVPDSVTVAPAAATLDAVGATQQFSATVTDQFGDPMSGVTVTWSSLPLGVATVDANGLATAVADGTTQITATAGSASGSADLTVAQQVATIVVTPDPATLIGVDATLQFSAEAFDANGFTLGTQPTFSWASDDVAVATVDPATGLATAEARGAAQITATADAVDGSAQLNVLGILHWTDAVAGTNAVPGALVLLGLTATVAADVNDFVNRLQQGGWGLVVFGEQGNAVFTGSVQTELQAYVTGGGELLAVTWVATPLAGFLEATRTGTNYTTVLTDAHPIFAGFGASITLSNPGWGVYAQRYQPVGAAECIGSTSGGDCAAILGHAGSTLLLGPLFDTYATLAEGEQLVAQSMQFLIDQATAAPTAGRAVGVQSQRAPEPAGPAPRREPGQRLQNANKSGTR